MAYIQPIGRPLGVLHTCTHSKPLSIALGVISGITGVVMTAYLYPSLGTRSFMIGVTGIASALVCYIWHRSLGRNSGREEEFIPEPPQIYDLFTDASALKRITLHKQIKEAPRKEILPFEILSLIFENLSLVDLIRASEVNRFFFDVASARLASPTIPPDWSQLFDKTIHSMLERSAPLEKIPFELLRSHAVYDKSDEELCNNLTFFPNLSSLTVDSDHITDEGLKRALGSCPKLNTLDLKGCNRLTQGIIPTIMQNYLRLQSLELACSIDEAAVELLSDSPQLHHLESLRLYRCPGINGGIEALLQRCPALKHLTFPAWGEIPQIFSQTYPSIESLTLFDADHLGIFLQKCPSLIGLNFTDSSAVTDASLQKIVEECPEIRFLNLRNCLHFTDQGILAVTRGCRKLSSLNLAGCYQLTPASMQAIMDGECPTLRSLQVSRDSAIGSCIPQGHVPNLFIHY